MALNARSLARLKGVHPDLVSVIMLAAERMPVGDLSFQITQGVRTKAEQAKLVAQRKSRTMNSRHIPAANGYAHAVDIVVYDEGRVSWHFPFYTKLAEVIKSAAADAGISIEWGGDWKSLKDGPHFQLPWNEYSGEA